jgi:hypothetical protein
MFDLLGTPRQARRRLRVVHDSQATPEGRVAPHHQPRREITIDPGPAAARPAADLPPSVARLAARTRLSAELLAAIMTVEGRSRATLDDMERADALADALLARRRQRAGGRGPALAAQASQTA